MRVQGEVRREGVDGTNVHVHTCTVHVHAVTYCACGTCTWGSEGEGVDGTNVHACMCMQSHTAVYTHVHMCSHARNYIV